MMTFWEKIKEFFFGDGYYPLRQPNFEKSIEQIVKPSKSVRPKTKRNSTSRKKTGKKKKVKKL